MFSAECNLANLSNLQKSNTKKINSFCVCVCGQGKILWKWNKGSFGQDRQQESIKNTSKSVYMVNFYIRIWVIELCKATIMELNEDDFHELTWISIVFK